MNLNIPLNYTPSDEMNVRSAELKKGMVKNELQSFIPGFISVLSTGI